MVVLIKYKLLVIIYHKSLVTNLTNEIRELLAQGSDNKTIVTNDNLQVDKNTILEVEQQVVADMNY